MSDWKFLDEIDDWEQKLKEHKLQVSVDCGAIRHDRLIEEFRYKPVWREDLNPKWRNYD